MLKIQNLIDENKAKVIIEQQHIDRLLELYKENNENQKQTMENLTS